MMHCKGVCFFADVPNAEAPHYIVIVSDANADDGRDVIVMPSFARYEWAKAIKQSEVAKRQLMQSFRYKCIVSDEILRRIQNGTKTSKELPPIFRKFFKIF